ncbi:hypothetical protein MLAC_13790 [Mycobacterium lacus]|uniref:GAP family protein n=1 Tax=Mycobacterium lacus TaxID=169765 RepID=A0A7I7NHF6_9MYCO|nr:hypothetical protein MLAC_13790 [Mycobacterium lacus]
MLFLGLVMATDPIRLGLAAVLVTRRQPMLNLFAFWLGGMVAGVALAVAVLVFLRDIAVVAIQTAASVTNEFRSAVVVLAGSRLQLTFGVIALAIAIHMVARERVRAQVPVGAGGAPAVLLQPDRPGLIARMAAVSHNMLTRGGFVWPAFIVGLTSSAPPIETVAALTVIMASGAGLGVQVSAFLVFILLVLTVIEIPLVAHLVVPRQTEAVLRRIDCWLRAHRRQITLTLLVVMGSIMLVQGVAGL